MPREQKSCSCSFRLASLLRALLVQTEQGETQEVKTAVAKMARVSLVRLPAGTPSRTASMLSSLREEIIAQRMVLLDCSWNAKKAHRLTLYHVLKYLDTHVLYYCLDLGRFELPLEELPRTREQSSPIAIKNSFFHSMIVSMTCCWGSMAQR